MPSIFKITLLVTCYTYCIASFAQDVPYAKEVVAVLASPEMKGRGYVERGDRKAADFIAKEFEKFGLKKFDKTYFQSYTTPVNSFPGKMFFKVGSKELVPGSDFLIEPGSPSVSGKFDVVVLKPSDLLSEAGWINTIKASANKFVVVEAITKKDYSADQLKKINEVISFIRYSPDHPAKGSIILTSDKLTWSGSQEVYAKPSFTVLASSVTSPFNAVELQVENKFFKSYETQNIAGYIEGEHKDSLIVVTAHYDHLGMMGADTHFPGANDNASGVAMVLNLAKHFSTHKPKYTTVFIAFSGEEIGLVGSAYFTDHPLFPLNKIKFLINFDLAGTGEEGIQVVNGKVYSNRFNVLTGINNEHALLHQVKARGEACNSDHCMFYRKGVKCFYIYTLGGIQAYHDIYDKAETLPLTEFEDYVKLLLKFITTL
jgi:aminopeptidase YwaD